MTMQASTTPQAAAAQAGVSVQDALAAYKSRRSELNSQLVELTVRRDLLTQQLRNASGAEAKELNSQLVIVGQRNSQVLKSLGDIDDAVNQLLINAPVLANAPRAQGNAAPGTTTAPPPGSGLRFSSSPVNVVAVVAIVMVFLTVWRSMRRSVASLSSSDVGRLEKLQQSVDAIAVEVERLGESQRYLSKVLGPGAAQEVGSEREKAAVRRP